MMIARTPERSCSCHSRHREGRPEQVPADRDLPPKAARDRALRTPPPPPTTPPPHHPPPPTHPPPPYEDKRRCAIPNTEPSEQLRGPKSQEPAAGAPRRAPERALNRARTRALPEATIDGFAPVRRADGLRSAHGSACPSSQRRAVEPVLQLPIRRTRRIGTVVVDRLRKTSRYRRRPRATDRGGQTCYRITSEKQDAPCANVDSSLCTD